MREVSRVEKISIYIKKHSETIKMLKHCVGAIIGWEIGKVLFF